MLCAPLKFEDESMLCQANRWADLIEFHIDHFQTSTLEKWRRLCHKPVIFKLSASNFNVLQHQPEYVDLPHTVSPEVFESIKKQYPQVKLICSYHDFEQTGDLTAVYRQLASHPAEIYKISTLARTTNDALRMLKFMKTHKCLGICMGELGKITRILAPIFGAPWTYAPLSNAHRTASGQLLLDELVTVYRYRKHSPKTSLYGLIGDPVKKSSSHLIHNYAFKKLGLNATYIKMRVTPNELEECLSLCKFLGFKGLSVTMPLKETVVRYLSHSFSQAVNTVGFKEEGVYGWNTDGIAALDVLEKYTKVKEKTIVLLGAGGAAWGVAHEAAKRGARLVILNRTLSRACRLAQVVGGTAFTLEEFPRIAQLGYDILINCTSVGMGDDLSIPISAKDLLEKKIVMEIVMRPRTTRLVAAAKAKQCEIIEGIDMFIQQAAEQYYHWFQEHLVDG